MDFPAAALRLYPLAINDAGLRGSNKDEEAVGRQGTAPVPFALCPLPYALCPMLTALCPRRSARRASGDPRQARCRLVYDLASSKLETAAVAFDVVEGIAADARSVDDALERDIGNGAVGEFGRDRQLGLIVLDR